jgi:Zn-dependent peptidase ImmA (M78 family)/transcriptional regulator with XRE-family HTH domain
LKRQRWGQRGGERRTSSPVEMVTQFSGERLRLARNLSGWTLTELGQRVAADAAFLSRIETGKQAPSDLLAAALSDELGFEREFFFDAIFDPFKLEQCHFRHLQRTSKRLKEMVLAQGTLLAELIGKLAEEVEFPPLHIPDIHAESTQEIESAAQACRQFWNLGENAPISSMVRLVENAGVLVVRLQENSRDVDAFSRFGSTAVIVLNDDKKSASRSRFDVAHELGHLVIHRGKQTGDPASEGQANRFASALLLPRDGFYRAFRQVPGFSWPHLFEMKRRWKVSVAAIVRRAYDLDLLLASDYRRAYKYIHAKGWHLGEPHEPPIEEPELLRLALDAYMKESGQTARELARSLGWPSVLLQQLTDVRMPPPPTPANVKPLSAYRTLRE